MIVRENTLLFLLGYFQKPPIRAPKNRPLTFSANLLKLKVSIVIIETPLSERSKGQRGALLFCRGRVGIL